MIIRRKKLKQKRAHQVNFETMLFSAITAGLFGSLHCAGMCGGIASALGMSVKQSSVNSQPVNTALFFQFGRISSYFVAGCIAGFLGDVITQAAIFKDVAAYLRLFSAVFMIISVSTA